MSKQTEALKLALEALEYISSHYMSLPKIGCMALAAVEEALAEQPAQQQEPVAWAFLNGQYAHIVWGKQRPDDEIHTIPLYTLPPTQKRPQNCGTGFCSCIECVMEPAQRKPLTDEMVVDAARMLSDRQAAACNVDCGDMWKIHGNDFIEDARAALEAAHSIKEKNT